MDRYKTRKQITCTIDNSAVKLLDELSKKTKIPRSRILDVAINLFNEKYGEDGYIKK